LSRVIEQFSSAQSEEAESGSGAIAYLRDSVVSILQNGPQCGLVTLQMAATSLRLPAVDVEHILKIAQQKGFTSRGEIDHFSGIGCYDMASLRGVIRDLLEAEELLRADSAVLIPYDCDKNNEPVILHGDCAHWCIVYCGQFHSLNQNLTNLSSFEFCSRKLLHIILTYLLLIFI
uniref:Actin maturation protease n=1 Tax=Anisakis simplex TaxID=6269 RepID=A0A0M3K070_ANISI